jgi:hypothetical protein
MTSDEDRKCESSWHKLKILKPFQECPICKSESVHLPLITLEEREAKND